MAAVLRLALDGGVPPPVEVKDVGRLLQVQSQASDAERQNQRLVLAAGLESLDDGGSLLLRRVSGDGERGELAQAVDGRLHARLAGYVLREHQRLVALRREEFDPVSDVVQLAGLAGHGVGVAYLLEPRDEFQDVAHLDFGAQFPQVDDAFLLGFFITPALPIAQFDRGHRDQLIGQVVQDLAFLAAELQFRVTPHKFGAGRVAFRAFAGVVVDELEDGRQLVLVVLDRRAGERPRALSG